MEGRSGEDCRERLLGPCMKASWRGMWRLQRFHTHVLLMLLVSA
jgi:hypothetical protein